MSTQDELAAILDKEFGDFEIASRAARNEEMTPHAQRILFRICEGDA